MTDEKLRRSATNLERALNRLADALCEPETNPLLVDAVIQRFEFMIELFWKFLKRLLEQDGVQTMTPKDALQRAFQAGWLDDEARWLEMLRDRNQTSHLYDEGIALQVVEHVRVNLPVLRRTFEALRARLAPD